MAEPEVLVVTRLMDSVMQALEKSYTLHHLYKADDKEALLRETASGIRGIATDGHAGASAALMDALPNLEIVACYGVGVDSIDLHHAAAHDILVTNTPDVLNDEVANLAIGLLLAISRGIVAGDRYVREGRWLDGNMALTHGIRGKTVGILGLGRIGKEITRKLSVFGCEIVYHGRREQSAQPYRYYPDLRTMAGDCDHLIAICPATDETRNIVNREVLDALGPAGTLVNVARGSVVDEPALIAALSEGRLGAAALDVFANEPHVPAALLDMHNVILQPHVASATTETRQAMGDLVVENLALHFAGEPVATPVTP
ncbi:MAG: 2-hydroxyacid dehydrogenase [Gammaproteobacteria bacterium]|nr:2-hydroxyacid dehydrogenase [Gammaproteobacteria bacterium]